MDSDLLIESFSVDDDRVILVTEMLATMGDESNVRILLAILQFGEMSVNHLADLLDIPPVIVSRNLNRLRAIRAVSERQSATGTFYFLSGHHLIQLMTDILCHAEHTLTDVPKHHSSTHPTTTHY